MPRLAPSSFLAAALSALLVATGSVSVAQSSFSASGDRILVRTEPTQEEGAAILQADCEIHGGLLYIDRVYVGTIPYVGSLSPGRHYVELALSGYDNLGIWLNFAQRTKYSVTFNPSGKIVLFSPDSRVSVSSKPTLNTGSSDLVVYSDIDGGMLYIDQNFVGMSGSTVPYTGSISPGSHYLKIELSGYHSLGKWIVFEEKTYYLIRFTPQRITGNLSIAVDPADASLSVDGTAAKSGLSEHPIGKHRILARHFGYVDQSLDANVQEGSTHSVSIKLESAPFAISGLGFSRAAFNPRNAGPSGRVSLDFQATNYGSAKAEIRGPDGSLVATLEYPEIKDWSQSSVWNGLRPDGSPLPDGLYRAQLVARPAAGPSPQAEGEGSATKIVGSDGSIEAEAQVLIDSSLVLRATGSASALPGLLFMPDPAAEPVGSFAAEAFWFAPWDKPESSAFGLSAAFVPWPSVTFALHASAESQTGPAASGDLAGSALVSLFGDKTSALAGAFFLRGAYSSSTAPSMPGAQSATEASLPLAARLGGSPKLDLRLALAPGARIDFSSASPAYLGLARAALWLEGAAFRAGLSGELPLDLSGGALFSSSWPAKAALEGRLVMESFVAAAYATAEFAPSAVPSFGIGVGLGLLF